MPVLTLNADNHNELAHAIGDQRWVVACLCAAWCGTCGSYRATFEELAIRHPDKQFVWIDIEDHADLLGDLDVENFPTLLIQRDETVAFFGTILPDAGVAQRLIVAQAALGAAELAAQATSSAERRAWQQDCNLRSMLRNAAD